MADKLMTVKQYADIKGVSTTAVYDWIGDGKLKSQKLGKITVIILNTKEQKELQKVA